MTTIVKHKRTGNEYILLGINGEEDKVNPSRFINELFSQEKSDVSCSATVCDFQGNIFLAYIDDLLVTEIDGKKPADILPKPDFDQRSQQVPSSYLSSNEDSGVICDPVSNDNYQKDNGNFEDDFEDDFEDEELIDNQENPKVKTNSPASTVVSPSQPEQSESDNDDDDDDDWI